VTGAPIRVGASACLLGAEVRFDGQHKRDRFLIDELGKLVEWVPVCPEVQAGMGVPRESVRLVQAGDGTSRLRGSRSEEDWTDRMNEVARRRVQELAARGLDGFVLKARSPTCGMERVKLYPAGEGVPSRDGVGLFAAELARQLPDLPVEEEGRLGDARLRDNFVERLFAFHELRLLWASPWTPGELVAFHTAHKLALLAHCVEGYRRLGRLVARAGVMPRAELQAQYQSGLMAALRALASPGRHANVLMHMVGYLRPRLEAQARAELQGLIDDHRRGLVPLVVPVTMMRHHLQRHGVGYLLGQSYLQPHPRELGLRNRV
jgi:uncharacterized protein YbgA (DUF1722 family)/uncharacterized protein YbbK (DUF523 family)